MNQPIIGITSSYLKKDSNDFVFLNHSYLNAVRHFGGIPMILPVEGTAPEWELILGQCDGVIFSGGNDLDPALYGEPIWNDTVTPAPERDPGELEILKLALERNLPILGICRGIQLLNVYFGGTLYQDIPTQLETDVKHAMEEPHHRTCHDCVLEPGSPLRALLGRDTIQVNSHHHQAVKDVAPGFEVMGRCSDGIVEAIWNPERDFLWAVQWHPEKIWDIEETSGKIFEAFLTACGE